MEKKSSNGLLTIAVLSLIALALFATMKTDVQKDKIFFKENYYQGYDSSIYKQDPKVLYQRMVKNLFTEYQCDTNITTTVNPGTTPMGWVWCVEGKSIKEPLDLEKVNHNSDYSMLQPFGDGDNIIAMSSYNTFLDSNTDYANADNIRITYMAGKQYKIVLENVKSWWCHMNNSNQMYTQHTDTVGYYGSVTVCTSGSIIGKANKNTKIWLYEWDSDENKWVSSSFLKLFWPELDEMPEPTAAG